MKLTSAEIKTGIAVAPLDASDSSGTPVAGIEIDRKGYDSCVITGLVGTASGSPSAQEVVFYLYESETSGGSYSAISGASVTLDGDSEGGEINVDLRNVGRYIKVYYDVSFTSGTTPKIEVAASYALGEAKVVPAT